MASVKSTPIRDPENGSVVGQFFEPSGAYLGLLNGNQTRRGNYDDMKRPDGKVVRVNRKLASRGHYEDKGFEPVSAKKGKE
jgi:hypothetical protein